MPVSAFFDEIAKMASANCQLLSDFAASLKRRGSENRFKRDGINFLARGYAPVPWSKRSALYLDALDDSKKAGPPLSLPPWLRPDLPYILNILAFRRSNCIPPPPSQSDRVMSKSCERRLQVGYSPPEIVLKDS